MSALVQTFLLSLGLTLLIELPLAFACGFRGQELLVALLVNVITNPLAVLLYVGVRALTPLSKMAVQLPIECIVIVSEWLVYRIGTERKHPFSVSLICNAASYALGLLWNCL